MSDTGESAARGRQEDEKNHIKEQSIIQASLNCQFKDSRLLYTEYLKTKKGKSLRENSGILPVIVRASADTLIMI